MIRLRGKSCYWSVWLNPEVRAELRVFAREFGKAESLRKGEPDVRVEPGRAAREVLERWTAGRVKRREEMTKAPPAAPADATPRTTA